MAVANKADDFLADLNQKITAHEKYRRVDAGFYQFLVIGAALAGFASLTAGLYYKSPEVAGVIGGLTSVATILSQQLRCVKAIDWRYRSSIELEAIKSKLLFEGSADEARVAALSAEVRDLERRMTEDWEKGTSGQTPQLGDISVRKKKAPKANI
jgi:hypothetical protein